MEELASICSLLDLLIFYFRLIAYGTPRRTGSLLGEGGGGARRGKVILVA